jgi:hypothetical protein
LVYLKVLSLGETTKCISIFGWLGHAVA